MKSVTAMRVVALAAAMLSSAAAAEEMPASRIDEIASSLPEQPRADGAPRTDRASWGRLAATDCGKLVLKRAERLLAEPVPQPTEEEYMEFFRNGNRSHYEANVGRLTWHTNGLALVCLAECLEGKGRFVAKTVEYIDAVCALKSWVLPAHDWNQTCIKGKPHIDLGSAAISFNLAYCLAWLGDALPAATREKVLAELDRRTFRPYLEHARGKRKIDEHWWFHMKNNWNSVCNCCVVRAALAVVPDRRLRAEFVAHAEGSVPYALAGYTADGYCSEGMGYWNYGYGHHLMMGLSVRAATGGKVDFFADPKTRKVMEYAYGYQLEDGLSPRFADGAGDPSPALLALGRQVWPDLVSTAALESPVFGGGASAFSLRAFGQEPPPAKPTMDVLPPRTWFRDAQVLIARAPASGGAPGLSIAFKGGHNDELHNHNDLGSYVIALDGAAMCGDPGGEVYTRRTFSDRRYESKVLNSYGHPVPVADGRLQRTGRAAAAKVVGLGFDDDEDSLTIDITSAYASTSVVSVVRTMKFSRERRTVEIADRVKFSRPGAFEVPVVTYRDWTREGDSMRFCLKHPKAERSLSFAVSASAPLKFRHEEIENPGRPSPRRLAFAFAEPVTDATITAVFTAK